MYKEEKAQETDTQPQSYSIKAAVEAAYSRLLQYISKR